MNRRQFISRSATALALSNLVGHEAFASLAPAPNKGRIGIQLYSVRDDLPNDFLGTLKKIAAMGYSQVEPYGFSSEKFFNYTMKELSKIVGDMGMTISSVHTNSRLLPEDTNAPEWDFWKNGAEYLKSGGGKYAVQAGFPGSRNLTIDELKRIAAHFNRVGEVCKKGGIRFAFHNHDGELKKVEDEVILEFLIKNTDPELVFFQIDLGHVVNGGGDCYRYMRDYPKRIAMWHASDFHATNRVYTILGKGSVPYPALFEMADSTALEVLTVEQETRVNTLAACEADFNYLKQFKWAQVI